MTDEPTEEQIEMIDTFQCSGCVAGPDPKSCDSFKFYSGDGFFKCEQHCAGTSMGLGNRIYLGMVKGFNKVGALPRDVVNNIRLWIHPSIMKYNYLNIPVWYRVVDKHLFIRVYSPRINCGFIEVIKNGDPGELPISARNVDDFIDEID